MNPGAMNERIALYQETDTVDSVGAPTMTQTLIATVWAAIENANETESNQDPQTVAKGTRYFTIHYADKWKAIGPKWIIKWRGKDWDIEGVAEDDRPRFRRRYLRITANARQEGVTRP